MSAIYKKYAVSFSSPFANGPEVHRSPCKFILSGSGGGQQYLQRTLGLIKYPLFCTHLGNYLLVSLSKFEGNTSVQHAMTLYLIETLVISLASQMLSGNFFANNQCLMFWQL